MAKITMDVIAAELGISKNTVSRALRGLSGVSEETRQRITAYASENGYKTKAKNISSLHIAMIYNKILNQDKSFWPSVLSGIAEFASDKGISLRIFTVDSVNSSGLISSIREQSFDGLLIINDLDETLLRQLQALKKPLLIADSYYNEIDCDYVNTDNHKGIYKAVAHLVENNHQRIGFIGVNDRRINFRIRYEAFLRSMDSFQLPVNMDYVWLGAEWADYDYFRNHMSLLKDSSTAPTAWICVNDAIMMTFASVLEEYNYRIPNDISLIGFDNISFPTPPIYSTLEVSQKELGQQALKQLLNRIEMPELSYKSIYIDTTLIKRESVKCL